MARHHQQSGQAAEREDSHRGPYETHHETAAVLNALVFDDDTSLLREECHNLLEKSGFVEDVIDLYINYEHRLRAESASQNDSRHRDPLNTGEWQQLVRTTLPRWMFWLVYIY